MMQAPRSKLLGIVVATLAVIAAAGYLFSTGNRYERQKMSVAELKEEFKRTDGDPAINAKIRRIRMSRVRKRIWRQSRWLWW